MQATSPPPFRSGSPPQSNGLSLPPPEKRQKLAHGPSPLATSHSPGSYYPPYSPQWSPHTTTTNGPPPAQSIPQPPPPSVSFYPPNPLDSFNQPQPVQAPSFEILQQQQHPHHHQPAQRQTTAGTMGPPERPQKPLDPNDITDMVALSGVDLRAEEESLAQSFLRSNSYSTSFDTQQGGSTQSQGNSFSQWSQGNFGSQPAFQAGPPFSQQPVTERSLEDELRHKHKQAARQYAERKQQHLRDPFLAAAAVREKIHRRAYEEHVRFVNQGLREDPVRQPGDIRPQEARAAYMTGTDGTGVVAANVRYTLEQDSPLVEVLCLLSLAANERVRSMLEDAYAVSRARQHGSQGVVPPEWSTLARGSTPAENTTAAPVQITQSSWDKLPESASSPPPPPKDAPQSQSQSQSQPKPEADAPSSGRLPTPPTEPSPPPPPQPTVSFKSPLPAQLQSLAEADLAAEKARLEKRKARAAALATGGASSAEPSSVTPAPTTAATADATADAAPVKMTKKALAAEKKSAVNEEVQRKQANATANMALGGGKKKYSWLSGGKAGGSSGLSAGAGMGRGVGTTPKSSAPSTPGPSTTAGLAGAGGAAQKTPVVEEGLREKGAWKGLGTWKEDGEGGKGVQIRDLVGVLERDGLEKRTLARCLTRLKE